MSENADQSRVADGLHPHPSAVESDPVVVAGDAPDLEASRDARDTLRMTSTLHAFLHRLRS
jgi:hypothetical protein